FTVEARSWLTLNGRGRASRVQPTALTCAERLRGMMEEWRSYDGEIRWDCVQGGEFDDERAKCPNGGNLVQIDRSSSGRRIQWTCYTRRSSCARTRRMRPITRPH